MALFVIKIKLNNTLSKLQLTQIQRTRKILSQIICLNIESHNLFYTDNINLVQGTSCDFAS